MRPQFTLELDDKGVEYFSAVVEAMITEFKIPPDEAVLRVNRQCVGKRFEGVCMVYHNLPERLAGHMLYGKSRHWWVQPPESRKLRSVDDPPVPLPGVL